MSAREDERADGGCDLAELATAYVQAELAGTELERFKGHLPSCAECRAEAESARELIERLRAAPEAEAVNLGVDLVDGVLAALPEDAWEPVGAGRDGSTFRWASRALQAAAALVAAVTLGIVVSRGPARPGTEHAAAADARACEGAAAVSKALAWLASTQGPDGSWNAETWGGQENYTPALTGLATLALLAETSGLGDWPDAARANAVRRAAHFLASAVGRSGRVGPRFDAALYNHGIATVALLEAFALTQDASLREPITRALGYIRSEQAASGGWGYAGGRPPNTAISVWQVNALLLAGSLGWPEARGSAVRGLAWIEGMIDAEGRAGYDAVGRFPNGPEGLTAMAALSLGAADGSPGSGGDGRSRAARSLVRAAAERPRDLDYYRAFFFEYALRAVERSASCAGGRSREMIVESQVTAGPNSGSFEPRDRWSSAGGRVYSTAMAALSLQADANAPRMIAMMRGGRR
jgi:hypothetical protein